MSTSTKFKVFRFESNAVQFPAIAICTSYWASSYLKAESFLLVQLSKETATSIGMKISVSNQAGANCPIVIDEAFALDEALRQAEVDFSIFSHDANAKATHPLPWPERRFAEVPASRLAAAWSHSPFRDELSRVRDTTGCEELKTFLQSFGALPTIKLTPLSM